MEISTIPHGRIALRSGTKNLEHSPSSVASIRRNDVAGEDATSAPRGAAPGTNYPASPLIGPAPNSGLSGKGAGWAPGRPFWPTCHVSSSHGAMGLDKRRRTSKIYGCRDSINGRVSPRSPYSLRPIWITAGTAVLGARVWASSEGPMSSWGSTAGNCNLLQGKESCDGENGNRRQTSTGAGIGDP